MGLDHRSPCERRQVKSLCVLWGGMIFPVSHLLLFLLCPCTKCPGCRSRPPPSPAEPAGLWGGSVPCAGAHATAPPWSDTAFHIFLKYWFNSQGTRSTAIFSNKTELGALQLAEISLGLGTGRAGKAVIFSEVLLPPLVSDYMCQVTFMLPRSRRAGARPALPAAGARRPRSAAANRRCEWGPVPSHRSVVCYLWFFKKSTFKVLGKGNCAIAGSSARLTELQPPFSRDGAAPSAF